MVRTAIGMDVALELDPGTDPRAPGGEVTVALCGSWEHDGPCRWPHNSRIDPAAHPARLRTVLVVGDEDRDEVLSRVEGALRRDPRWRIVSLDVGGLTGDEESLAARLRQSGTVAGET